MPHVYLVNTDENDTIFNSVNLPDVADSSGSGRMLEIFALCMGGGGAGSISSAPGGNGSVGTGGGGGGGCFNSPVWEGGGSGGPGIVIIAYPK